LLEEERYTLRSALIAPTAKELRDAGTDYPVWVEERYLQLPDDLPESIQALAAQLVAGRTVPYNKVRAITNYLRAEITYSDTVPAPPQGRDALEWFLFTWREGYCNYSATAEVVLLRAAGVPARLVVGFAQGKRNADGDYVVLRRNAHAWAEVYFPEIGWVEFEATRNQTPLIRPSGEEDRAEEEELLDFRQLREDNIDGEGLSLQEEEEVILPEKVDDTSKIDYRVSYFWGMIVLLTGVVLFALWYFNRKQADVTRGVRFLIQIYEKNNWKIPKWLMRLSRWSETNPIARAFYGVNTSLRLLGEEVPAHFTPQERVAVLIRWMPENEDEIMALLAEHQKALFTPEEGDLKIAQHASRVIRWQAFRRKLS